MNNEYINKNFYDRYQDICSTNNQLINSIQEQTIKDLDIYRQILKNWENEIYNELGIRIIYDFNKNKFKVNLPKKEKEIQEYFSKRKEILKFIFSPLIISKVNDSQTSDLLLKEKKLIDFYHYILNIYDKRMVTNKENELIKTINFKNTFAIYESIIKNIKEIKYIILPLNLQNDENLEFNRLKTITVCSGPWFDTFERTKQIYGKNNSQTWAEFLTEMADDIINYENQLFKSFGISINDLNNSNNIEIQNPKKYNNLKNVPKDGNCLFWGIIFAYLESVKTDQYHFQKRHKNLFGDDTEYNFILEKKNLSFSKYRNNKKLVLLFRNKIVEYIQENLDTYRGEEKSNFRTAILDSEINKEITKKYPNINEKEQIIKALEIMKKDGTWGGSIEIEAICNILNCQIIRNNEIFLPDIINSNSIKIKLHFENNHYQYFLIKNTKKSNNNPSISFSIDKILEEKPSNKKQKFIINNNIMNLQNQPSPLWSVAKLNDINNYYKNYKPSSVFNVSTINSNYSTGTFRFTSDERPTSNCSTFTSSTINSNYSTGTFRFTSDERPTSNCSTFTSSTINSNYSTGTFRFTSDERPTSNCSTFTSSTINSNYSTGTFRFTSDERPTSASSISTL